MEAALNPDRWQQRFWASAEIWGLVFRYPPVISRLGLLLKR